jgi:hypothetical protein
MTHPINFSFLVQIDASRQRPSATPRQAHISRHHRPTVTADIYLRQTYIAFWSLSLFFLARVPLDRIQ